MKRRKRVGKDLKGLQRVLSRRREVKEAVRPSVINSIGSEARNYFKELMVKDLMFDTEPKLSEIVLDSIIGI